MSLHLFQNQRTDELARCKDFHDHHEHSSRFLRMRHKHRYLLGGVAAALTVAASDPVPGPGYLATLGPPPLRFQAPPKEVVKYILPPLETPEEETEKTEATVVPPLPPPVPVTVIQPPPVEPVILTNQQFTVIVDGSKPEDPGSGTQALLKFFSRGTNQTTIVAPVDFRPPQVSPAPSSKATYNVGP